MIAMIDVRPLEAHNALLRTPQDLRAMAEREGYLFLRGLLPRERLLELAHAVLELCDRAAWLDPHAPVASGRARAGVVHVEPEPQFMILYDEVLKLERFHALAHEPVLVSLFDSLFGEPTLVHARNIARVMFPGAPVTPAHQDHLHIRGTPDTWTAWIPLGDCPQVLGGLAILPGSHRMGLLPVRPAAGAGRAEVDVEQFPNRFHSADFAMGDVLLFHSLTVHKALPNRVPRQLRLSVDYRYQPVSEPYAADSFEPHYGRMGWEQIYQAWTSQRFQFYWLRGAPQNSATQSVLEVQ